MKEREYQAYLIKTIRKKMPDSMVLINDPTTLQGVPDLLILRGERWGMLEIKMHFAAHKQANQDYYVDLFNKMSFALYIYPENEEVVLDALQQSLSSRG